MFGLFKSKQHKALAALKSATANAADQFIFFRKVFDDIAGNSKVVVTQDSFWSNTYILGILSGLVEINMSQSKLDFYGPNIAMGMLLALNDIEKKSIAFPDEDKKLEIVEKLHSFYLVGDDDKYLNPDKNFALAAKRSMKLALYAAGLKDYELDEDFIEIRNILNSKAEIYATLVGEQWATAKDRTKVVSAYVTHKLVLEALNSLR